MHTGEKPYKCDVCPAEFSQRTNLQQHKRTHPGKIPYKCDVCPAEFSQRGHLQHHKHLRYHKLTRTDEKPYKCDVRPCGVHPQQEPTATQVTRPRSHTSVIICPVEFSQSEHLSSSTAGAYRYTGDTGEKPYKCDICPVEFSQSEHLRYHKPTRTDEKPYMCDVRPCKVHPQQEPTATEVTRARSHTTGAYRYTGDTGEKPYKCDICPVVFSQSEHLRYHKPTRTDEKPYKCDICPVEFSQSEHLSQGEHLRYHKPTHMDEKPYMCDVRPCKVHPQQEPTATQVTRARSRTSAMSALWSSARAKFSERRNLQQHKRTHPCKTPYKCDVCPAEFSQSEHLRYHKPTRTGAYRYTGDTGEKQYKCDVCPAEFRQRGHLQHHRQTHTGEKPYNCDLCPAEFSRSGYLQ
ncbi:zinc finger protein 431-like [Ornithodoros turicata]|uniref:zinc finger protein 431-like n=1 Tax=Ornithodoros turicata TaxID=34597 RepID=UPI00313A49D2